MSNTESNLRGAKGCTDCQTDKHFSEFHSDHSSQDGRADVCKPCRKIRYANYGATR